MNDVLDAIVNYEALPANQREALHAALTDNPELAELFIRWQEIQQQVRDRLATSLPDRNLLVLYALSLKNEAYLTDPEKVLLERSGHQLSLALKAYPALHDVVKDIQDAEADFTRLWPQYVPASQPLKRKDRPASKPDGSFQFSRRFTRSASLLTALLLFTMIGYLGWQAKYIETIDTGTGEFKVVNLADGSTVKLLGESSLSYRKSTTDVALYRSVKLKGQAFFDIAAASEAFTVETPTALTTATGTRFTVEADRKLTEVVLTSGQIMVDSKQLPGSPVLLKPGQMSRIERRKAPQPPVEVANLTEKLNWTGLLIFHRMPLSSVSEYISKHYNIDFSVSPALEDQQFYGTFDPDTLSVEVLLDNIAFAFSAEIDITADSAYVLR